MQSFFESKRNPSFNASANHAFYPSQEPTSGPLASPIPHVRRDPLAYQQKSLELHPPRYFTYVASHNLCIIIYHISRVFSDLSKYSVNFIVNCHHGSVLVQSHVVMILGWMATCPRMVRWSALIFFKKIMYWIKTRETRYKDHISGEASWSLRNWTLKPSGLGSAFLRRYNAQRKTPRRWENVIKSPNTIHNFREAEPSLKSLQMEFYTCLFTPPPPLTPQVPLSSALSPEPEISYHTIQGLSPIAHPNPFLPPPEYPESQSLLLVCGNVVKWNCAMRG